MLQLQNNTPFAVSTSLFPNEEAIDTLYVLVKGTFNIGKQWTLADEQLPPLEGDEYWGEPGESSIKYASDYHTGKPGSDIVMLGHAFAPDGKKVHQLDVSLTLGQVHKAVRVFGDRYWQDGRISVPQPFSTMAMTYEKAYGGAYIVNGETVTVEERNPVGCGYAGQHTTEEMNGTPLPNLEDPNDLISDLKHQPVPACFGVSAPHWRPRSAYAGTYDEAWKTSRLPYLPEDFDRRFFNMAHPDLVYPGFLQGGESVAVTNMHIGGPLHFQVPHVKLSANVLVAGNSVHPPFNLETLIIEPNKLKLGMVWRAAIQCNKQALKISDIKVSMAR